MCHSCHVKSCKATAKRYPIPRKVGRYDYRAQIIALGPEYNKHKCGLWCFRFHRDWRIKCLLNHPFAPFFIPDGMLPRRNAERLSRPRAAFRRTPESLRNRVSNADSDEDEVSGYDSSESDYFSSEHGYTSSESADSPSESDYFASESGYSSSEAEDSSSESGYSLSGSDDTDDSSSDSDDFASEAEDSSSDSNDFALGADDSSSDSNDFASEADDSSSDSDDSSSDSDSVRSPSTGSTLPFRQPPPPPPPSPEPTPPPSPELAPQQVPNSWCGGIDCPFPYCMFDS